jgi:hypothetical protein
VKVPGGVYLEKYSINIDAALEPISMLFLALHHL